MRLSRLVLSLACVLTLGPGLLFAATAKTYQATGPVLEVTADFIAIQKGTERWEIARDGTTKITGDVKVGAKVTIEYRMMGTSVEVKPDTSAKKPAPAKKP
jgi:hypothetical protein